jgi:hypothetical protein
MKLLAAALVGLLALLVVGSEGIGGLSPLGDRGPALSGTAATPLPPLGTRALDQASHRASLQAPVPSLAACFAAVEAAFAGPLAAAHESVAARVGRRSGSEAADVPAMASDGAQTHRGRRAAMVLILIAGAVLTLALALGLAAARGPTRGLGRVRVVAETLAAGDFRRSSGLAPLPALGGPAGRFAC